MRVIFVGNCLILSKLVTSNEQGLQLITKHLLYFSPLADYMYIGYLECCFMVGEPLQ